MFAVALLAVSLLVPVNIDPLHPLHDPLPAQMSARQKAASIQPLITRTTICVTRAVKADPHFSPTLEPPDISVILVEAITSCAPEAQAMIARIDELFGAGEGEKFFMGPFLDRIPQYVDELISQ